MPIAPNQMKNKNPKQALAAFTKAAIKKYQKPKLVGSVYKCGWITGKYYRESTTEEAKTCPF